MNGERGCRETPSLFLRPHRPRSWSPIRDYTQRRYTQQKEPENNLKLFLLCVALERFELSQAEPESDVLPLHHKAIFQFVINSSGHRYDHFVFDVAKVGSFSELCKFFGRKFSKNFIFTSFKPILGRFYLINLFQQPSIG